MLSRLFTAIGIILICTNLHATPLKKTVLITGGLSGIGRETALAFQNAGWNVWVTSHQLQNREALNGVNVRALDLTDEKAIKSLLSEIQAQDKRLDVLVNNAAYSVIGPIETISAKQARDIMDINVIGPVLLTQQALPLMRANNSGHIINISSSSGLRALPGLGLYSASKMALEGFSEALAAEVAPWNIQVVLVEPGSIKNDWVHNATLTENLNVFPAYKSFTSKLKTRIAHKALDVGQESQAVAQLVLDIANNPTPDLRYQTNTTVSALAHEILVDPTGNKMREQTINMSRELYEIKF